MKKLFVKQKVKELKKGKIYVVLRVGGLILEPTEIEVLYEGSTITKLLFIKDKTESWIYNDSIVHVIEIVNKSDLYDKDNLQTKINKYYHKKNYCN